MDGNFDEQYPGWNKRDIMGEENKEELETSEEKKLHLFNSLIYTCLHRHICDTIGVRKQVQLRTIVGDNLVFDRGMFDTCCVVNYNAGEGFGLLVTVVVLTSQIWDVSTVDIKKSSSARTGPPVGG
jgi:hypothetical protein